MKRIFDWFKKRPATKANWITVFITICTFIVIAFQTHIFNRQTNLLDKQTKISETQSLLLSNQIEASTRPFMDIKLEINNKDSLFLFVSNKGPYSVKNVQILQLYFAKIVNHGWYVAAPTIPLDFVNIDSKKSWSRDMANYVKPYKNPPVANSFTIQNGSEFLIILVSFERAIDGKGYLCILPGYLDRNGNGIEMSPDGVSITGPLAKICNHGLELTLEYLKRNPFLKDYELYNSNYTLGYAPTGCLGQIEWTK